MKKILFMLINMNVGGTEKALLNMLDVIPKDKYDITILMLEKFGGFLNSIPSDIHVEYLQGYNNIKDLLNEPPQFTALGLFKEGKIVKAFNIVLLHLISKIMHDRTIIFKYLSKDLPFIDRRYDVAVAFAGPMEFITYFVLDKIKAKTKIQWIHFDVTKIGFNQRFARKKFKKFDKIFVVSNEGKNKLVDQLPDLNEKTDALSNVISKELVIKLADEGPGFTDGFNGTRILTVGRLAKEKGQDLTIPVLAKLKAQGYNVRWYCVGEGNARAFYEQLIKRYGVENDYILLGADPNPYPFMKQCDIYVQSSRHEGYCITLSEAKCFNNPIISTSFTGAGEQIVNNQTGLIVDFDEQQVFTAVQQLLDNEILRNTIKRNLRYETANSTKGLEKLYKIIDTIN